MAKEQKTKGRADETDAFVGARLRELRLAAGQSQEDVAKEVGMTFQQIQKYEGGKNRIAAGTLYRLAVILGVSIATFFPDQVEGDELVARQAEEIRKLREIISGTSKSLADSLKR